jgi:hypothetical protein
VNVDVLSLLAHICVSVVVAMTCGRGREERRWGGPVAESDGNELDWRGRDRCNVGGGGLDRQRAEEDDRTDPEPGGPKREM